MLRLTELKLPLDHDEPALRSAIVQRLKIKSTDLIAYHVFRRGWDALIGHWSNSRCSESGSAVSLVQHPMLRLRICSGVSSPARSSLMQRRRSGCWRRA